MKIKGITQGEKRDVRGKGSLKKRVEGKKSRREGKDRKDEGK